MKKIFVNNEETIMKVLRKGQSVQGRLRLEKTEDGRSVICFRQYVRHKGMKERVPDKVLCQLPHGWLKESPQRLKFFSSVKKSIGVAKVLLEMECDLQEAENVLILNA